MKISVIIPTYNRANVVRNTLDSIIKQNYPLDLFEILVVDNNSTDDTKAVVSSYIDKYPEHSIRYLFEPRQGLVFARHTGAKYALHEILAYCDDDGTYASYWLSEIAKVYSIDSSVCAVGGKIDIRWDEMPPDWVLPYEGLLGKIDLGDKVIIDEGLFINGGNFSIKKSILYKLGGFNPDQVGEWLIGDGETGLCKKMHEAGCKIGWAPKAEMEHHQIVRKNATVEDIKRRYYNNGIGVPYRIYSIDKKGTTYTVLNTICILPELFKWYLRFIKAKLVNNEADKLYSIFNLAYYSSQIKYVTRMIKEKSFRNELLREDWF